MSKKIEYSIVGAIKSELSMLTFDYTEIGLDRILDEGLWKDIPAVSTIVGIVKTGLNIKDRLFLKKLFVFLSNIKNIPLEKRVRFFENNYDSNEEEIGEKLIMLIDGLDDLIKPIIISRLFRAYVYECIDRQMFMRLSLIVQKCFIDDLILLKENIHKSMKGYEALNLYNNGLMEISNFNEVEQEKTEYDVNFVGKNLIKYGFEEEID